MPNIHPHWESDGEEIPVHVHEAKDQHVTVPEDAKPVSRQPAAIVGILTVIAGGYVFFQGVTSLTGQVINEDRRKIVQITEQGLDPAIIEVEHGDTITWQNTQATPYTFVSDTLCSDTGFCLHTKNLSEGDSDNFTITMDMVAGTYAYQSTESSVHGSVVITTTATNDHNTIFDNAPPAPVPQETEPPQSLSPFDAPDAQVLATTEVTTNIPYNPYTANSQKIHPFDSQGNPIESAFEDIPTQNTPAPLINRNGRSPVSQPTTGAGGIWLLVLGSILFLWYATRHHFEKSYQL